MSSDLLKAVRALTRTIEKHFPPPPGLRPNSPAISLVLARGEGGEALLAPFSLAVLQRECPQALVLIEPSADGEGRSASGTKLPRQWRAFLCPAEPLEFAMGRSPLLRKLASQLTVVNELQSHIRCELIRPFRRVFEEFLNSSWLMHISRWAASSRVDDGPLKWQLGVGLLLAPVARRVLRELREAAGVVDAVVRNTSVPEWSDRVIFDQATLTVTVDNKPVHIPHPPMFQLFRHIAEAGGKVVPREDLHHLSGCKGRIDVMLSKHLPKPLRALIHSKRGHGGGYWLQLPGSAQ